MCLRHDFSFLCAIERRCLSKKRTFQDGTKTQQKKTMPVFVGSEKIVREFHDKKPDNDPGLHQSV